MDKLTVLAHPPYRVQGHVGDIKEEKKPHFKVTILNAEDE
jgi:hypothetical protein